MMSGSRRRRLALLSAVVLAALSPLGAAAPDPAAEEASVLSWRAARTAELTSDTGWLTLAGLLWLNPGTNSFGSAPSNDLVLGNGALAGHAGDFEVTKDQVRFHAEPGANVLLGGAPVKVVELRTDAQGEPTVLTSGPLRFFVIARGGRLAVRVRDLDNPRRLEFKGLQYFPISTQWVVTAHFERYPPGKRLPIVNVLGMQEEQLCPGALVFTRNGRQYRLDAVLEQPDATELFVMLADTTSGRETYGGGRFLHVARPAGDTALVDFNKAYNPPCALNDFATCPLPPPQNRLPLRIDAGELRYGGAAPHGAP
jgi:uncharacterized protein (DUF1684 family)